MPNSSTQLPSYLARSGASTKCQFLSLTIPIFTVKANPPWLLVALATRSDLVFPFSPRAIARVFAGYSFDQFPNLGQKRTLPTAKFRAWDRV